MSIGVARVLPDGVALWCNMWAITSGRVPASASTDRIKFIAPRVALCRFGVLYPEVLDLSTLPTGLEDLSAEELVRTLDEAQGKAWTDFVWTTLAKWTPEQVDELVLRGPFNSSSFLLAGIADRPFIALVGRGLRLAKKGETPILGKKWPQYGLCFYERKPFLATESGKQIVASTKFGKDVATGAIESGMSGIAWSAQGPVNRYIKRWLEVGKNVADYLERLDPRVFGGSQQWTAIREGFAVQRNGGENA